MHECIICYDKNTNINCNNCKVAFHKKCLLKWLSTRENNACPYCTHVFTDKQLEMNNFLLKILLNRKYRKFIFYFQIYITMTITFAINHYIIASGSCTKWKFIYAKPYFIAKDFFLLFLYTHPDIYNYYYTKVLHQRFNFEYFMEIREILIIFYMFEWFLVMTYLTLINTNFIATLPFLVVIFSCTKKIHSIL